jgi:aminoglycoside phosphotransferase (APT) family kinase protein
LTIEGPQAGQQQSVTLQGIVRPPGAAARTVSTSPTFATDGWGCYLPELRLELQTTTPESPAFPTFTDPEPRVLIQGPIQEQRTLEELIDSAITIGTPAALDELQGYLRKVAVGLAELHRSGVTPGRTLTWPDRLTQARAALDGLAGPLPELAAAAAPLLARLEALAAAAPADPVVPAHGAFRPAQVLLQHGEIGFSDSDGFCQAEPAIDLGRFLAAAKDIALAAVSGRQKGADDTETAERRLQTLVRFEGLCAAFLAQYELLMPVSRSRIALWEALDNFTLVVSCWKKIEPARLKNSLLILERQLSASGLYAELPGDRPQVQPDSATIKANDLSHLRTSGTLPAWLLAPLQADLVSEALRTHVPELASGALALRSCKIKRMLLQGSSGRWAGTYKLTVEGPDGKRPLALRGTFTPPTLRRPEEAASLATALPFGQEGWRLSLPELGLELELEPPETVLAAMPRLLDPAESRALLEQGLRAGSPERADLRIEACTPEVLSYKPGSRCTLRYHLTYPPELAGRSWPSSVIAKTYRKDSKGRNAYDGMLALWRSPLADGAIVTLAEPLAYIPELKIMVQAPIAGEQSLEDLLKSALSANTQPAIEALYGYMRQTAAGLAAFHQSGVRHGEPVLLDQRFAEIRELIARLIVAVPELAGAVEPFLARLEVLATAEPADAAVPTHGTFNPEQVLIDGQRIGFIDFDDFCMAEPALDVALFRAAIKDIGMNALDESMTRQREIRLARLARLDMIGEVFLAEYEKHAPISRQRVALWEAWSYLRDALHFWIKVKPAEPDNGLLMLESQLRAMGLYQYSPTVDVVHKPRKGVSLPTFRYLALASSLIASAWLDNLAEVIDALLSVL